MYLVAVRREVLHYRELYRRSVGKLSRRLYHTLAVCILSYQLESVGPGSVLRDLIASEKVPVYQLTKVYRQSEDSQIVANANKVKDGNMDIKDAEDFKIIRRLNEADVTIETMKIFKKNYDKENPYDFQILSPIKASLAGVNHINEIAQQEIYADNSTKHITVSRKKYHIGDKIIFLQNEPSRGFYMVTVEQSLKSMVMILLLIFQERA